MKKLIFILCMSCILIAFIIQFKIEYAEQTRKTAIILKQIIQDSEDELSILKKKIHSSNSITKGFPYIINADKIDVIGKNQFSVLFPNLSKNGFRIAYIYKDNPCFIVATSRPSKYSSSFNSDELLYCSSTDNLILHKDIENQMLLRSDLGGNWFWFENQVF